MAERSSEITAEDTIILRLDNVSKSFAKVEHDEVAHALNEVSPSTKNGEFISLVRLSDRGKSTMLRFVAGLIPPITGHLTANGTQITGPSPEWGMMFQKPTLFPWLTVEKSISFSLKPQGKLKGNEEKVERMLKIIGLESLRNDYPSQLSGGMVQRVSLVRPLIDEPDVSLLGESLGALDAFTRMSIQDEILKVWQEKKQLVIMVIHNVDEAIYTGTRVIVTDAHPGRVVPDIRIDRAYPRECSSQTFAACRNEILDRLHSGGRSSGQRQSGQIPVKQKAQTLRFVYINNH